MIDQANFWKFIEENRTAPFVWGEHDCCFMAAKMLDATRGGDHVKRLKALYDYSTALQAARIMDGGLEPLITEFLGPSIPVARCHLGDVVLLRAPQYTFEMLGIHDGTCLLGVGEQGLEKVRFDCAVCGWSP